MRDKFLTEAMGECWHEWVVVEESPQMSRHQYCPKCGERRTIISFFGVEELKTDFSTWDGFGKLWKWAQQQKWWGNFCIMIGLGCLLYKMSYLIDADLIHPDRFADAVYQCLKEDTK